MLRCEIERTSIIVNRKECGCFWGSRKKSTTLRFQESINVLGDECEVKLNVAMEFNEWDSIWLEWRKSIWSATILDKQKQWMHAMMLNQGGYSFHITVIYGESNVRKQCDLWAKIEKIKGTIGRNDWLAEGDFNEIRRPKECDGRGEFDQQGASKFNDEIDELIELEVMGGNFTWSNGVGLLHIRSRQTECLGILSGCLDGQG